MEETRGKAMDYLDTSYVVALAVKTDVNHSKALSLENHVSNPVITRLTIAELYAYFARTLSVMKYHVLQMAQRLDEAIEAMVEYSVERSGAKLVDIDMDAVVEDVIRLASKVPLKTLDLMHLAAAARVGAERIVTLDMDFHRKRDLIKKVLGLDVLVPQSQ